MKYPKEYLDEIKTRLKVSNVVSKTVSLKKRGKEFIGLSPFKNEKTPSFTVNDEKGFYHCFSTGEHGNIFDFVMKTQNLKFGETVRMLANLAGMQPFIFSKEQEEKEKKFKSYVSVYADYIRICHNNIISKSNQKIMQYLNKRDLNLNVINKFKLGFNDDKENIYDTLNKKHNANVLNESGLFYFDEKKNKFVEKFRNRLIFPIYNISDNPIGVGGRIIEKSNYLAKYINSPETLFFKKGSNLYNLNYARKLSNKFNTVYIVEGYMDVIGMSKNGIENVVANLGTALTERQVYLLNQFFDHIIICFDGDNSGKNAALRAAENSVINLVPEKKISFLFLPEGEDPDSFISKEKKINFLKYSEEKLISIHEYIFSEYKKSLNKSPSSFAVFEKKLRKISNSIKDNLMKKYTLEFYLDKLSELTPNQNFKKKFYKNKIQKSLNSTQKYFNDSKNISSIEIKEFSFICIILKNLNFFQNNLNLIKEVNLFTKENRLIFEKIRNELTNNEQVSNIETLDIDKNIIEKIFKFASIKYIVELNEKNEEKITDLLSEIKRDLKNYELEKRIEELESKFSKDFNENTFNELKELKKLQKIN